MGFFGDWQGNQSLQGMFDAAAAGGAGVGLGEETTAATGRLEGAIASLRNEISVFRLG